MNDKGQTLIETIIAVAVIGIVVTALIGMGVVAMRTAASARNQSQAVKLASEGMEMARSVRDQGSLDDVNNTNLPNGGVTVGSLTFTRTWKINGDSSKKTIVVEVSWPESSGTKSVSVSSYLTNWR